jgi:hypothetical protein
LWKSGTSKKRSQPADRCIAEGCILNRHIEALCLEQQRHLSGSEVEQWLRVPVGERPFGPNWLLGERRLTAKL